MFLRVSHLHIHPLPKTMCSTGHLRPTAAYRVAEGRIELPIRLCLLSDSAVLPTLRKGLSLAPVQRYLAVFLEQLVKFEWCLAWPYSGSLVAALSLHRIFDEGFGKFFDFCYHNYWILVRSERRYPFLPPMNFCCSSPFLHLLRKVCVLHPRNAAASLGDRSVSLSNCDTLLFSSAFWSRISVRIARIVFSVSSIRKVLNYLVVLFCEVANATIVILHYNHTSKSSASSG